MNEFDLNDKVLVRRVNNKVRIQEQVVVPRILQPEILRGFTTTQLAGLCLTTKCLARFASGTFGLE